MRSSALGTCWSQLETPLGPLLLVASTGLLHEIRLPVGGAPRPPDPGWVRNDEILAEARRQLTEYFTGARRCFDLDLGRVGTPFQRAVLDIVERIPWGQTTSYGAIARQLGKPGAARAVGLANGANPLPIVIPCHRVIGADGSLTGFGGGLDAKRWLLGLEGHPEMRQQGLFGA